MEMKMLPTPYAYLHMEQVKENIRRMVARLTEQGVAHRPHIKTHKSAEIAKLQLQYGAKGITVAKLSEAEVMADHGIRDILIAFPIIGGVNVQRLQRLHEKCSIRTTVDSIEAAEGLSAAGVDSGKPIDILIELDGGIHRGGVQPGEDVVRFAETIRHLPGIRLMGVLSYAGQIYGSSGIEELKAIAQAETDMLVQAKQLLNKAGFSIEVLSGGSTIASFYPKHLRGLTESRAGNYVFGDRNAIHHHVMEEQDCALRIRSTVVSMPLPGYATIDAGSKTLSGDLSVADGLYGKVVGRPGVELVKLNEEHGYLRFDPLTVSLNIGDVLEIIPNHSCVVPNLRDSMMYVDGDGVVGQLTVDARGRNY